MRFLDLLRMSTSSLWKRKIRTILTVLGVVVGTASIVVMISLGLGLTKATMESIEQYGGLTTITVYEKNNYYSGEAVEVSSDGTSSEATEEVKHLDDSLVETISAMEFVDSVSPVLTISAIAKYGNYEGYLNVQGMTREAMENLNLEFAKGGLPESNDELKFVYGNMVLQDFSNSKTGESYWSNGVLPDIDLVDDPLFIIFDTDAYWGSQNDDGSGTVVAPPKKYLVPGAGLIAGGIDEYNQSSWAVYCDIDLLTTQLKRIFKNKVIPGQPTMKSGKPYKEMFYSNITVNVDDMENVQTVQTAINELGYEASSNIDWIESEQEQAGYIQAVLGGIGAVSLFVAAIGITNTMMMSIYERTKEIGVMKVLGCDMRNIRSLFLMEAGFIGFIGGIFGAALSYLISVVINNVVAQSDFGMSTLSYIPPWLALLSVGFAIIVGMVAGFFPALRAMKLSPLAAIRTE